MSEVNAVELQKICADKYSFTEEHALNELNTKLAGVERADIVSKVEYKTIMVNVEDECGMNCLAVPPIKKKNYLACIHIAKD